MMIKNAPISVFDGLRDHLAGNRAEFYRGVPILFYGFNRPDAKRLDGVADNWWRQSMMGAINAQYECIKAFSETDFNSDLEAISVPTLVLHGDDDQIVPIALTSVQSAKIIRGATLKVYPGYSHGMLTLNANVINPDLLAFIQN
jgi:non-heme chloroperoxidase